MGIQVEYNPDLALRNISEYKNGKRKLEECVPENIEAGKIYPFFKKDQRNFWFFGEIPLLETSGNQILSRPKASIIILVATHFVEGGKIYTKGKYKVVEVFKDDNIYFEGFNRV